MTEFARPRVTREVLNSLYVKYNRREYVHPDPLELLYAYEDVRDREIVGLIASSLAYGRVRQILRSVSTVLERVGSPSSYLKESDEDGMRSDFRDFKYRFTTGQELAGLLAGARRAIDEHGSLEGLLNAGLVRSEGNLTGAQMFFAETLNAPCGGRSSLIPDVCAGSACKRLNLYFRWMVRRDDVDPGGWDSIAKDTLLVPLDTHMYSICRTLGLTTRAQPDAKAVAEITGAFQAFAPDDPVKYDFALTRLGIRDDSYKCELYAACGLGEGM